MIKLLIFKSYFLRSGARCLSFPHIG